MRGSHLGSGRRVFNQVLAYTSSGSHRFSNFWPIRRRSPTASQFVWPIRRRSPIVSRLSGLYIVCLPLLFSFLVYTSSVSHCLLSPLAYTSSVSHYFANLPQCGPDAQGLTCCQQHRVDLYRFNQRQENARRQNINFIQKYPSRQMRRQTCNLPCADNDS